MDYILADSKVCWTDIKEKVIGCTKVQAGNTNAHNKEIVADSGILNPEGLACDWINRKLYWTDAATRRIEVVDLQLPEDGGERHRKVLVYSRLDMPRSIAVSPLDGLMFWSDWGKVPKIERAGMDGDPSSRVELVSEDVQWPNGITLDLEARRLYWVDGKLQQISSVDWDGRDRRRVQVAPKWLPQPFAISFFRGELFWTDWTTRSIYRFNDSVSATAMGRQRPRELGLQRRPFDIKVFDPKRQPLNELSSPPPCSKNNGGCSHLCLAADNFAKFSCACPTGKSVFYFLKQSCIRFL